MYDVVIEKFTFAISSPDEFLYYKNSSGGETANVNFYAVRTEATRIR